ncbi:MAG TPA: GNAT family N-acetyltransferase [Pseudolysinimonas sp.]|jgi:GNAT superfamily N-acetyltransferase
MSEFMIEEVPRPTSLEGDAGAVFEGIMAVHNASEVAAYGIPEVATLAAEALPEYVDPHEDGRYFVARVSGGIVDGGIVGGGIVGYGHLRFLLDSPETAWHDVRVLPGFRGRGIGRALSAAVESASRELGQTRLITYAVHPDAPGPQLTAPTGFGAIPAGNREVRFLLARGWTFEQVERASRFALPGDPARLAAARAGAGSHAGDYRIVSWAGLTPPEWREGSALLNTRMSTDAPSGDLGEPEDVWDVDRLVTSEQLIEASPQQFVVTAAVHRVTGAMAGITRLVVPDETERAVNQWATIVLSEHRGHRLGMLMKTANLEFLERVAPGHPSVLTWNAEENRPMLSVNEAVGFVRIGAEGAWKKALL